MKIFVNALTLSRIVATIFLPMIWNMLHPPMLIILIALILLTDFFDGLFARKFHTQSLFGSIMDAIADKVFGIVILLLVSSYISLFYFIVLCELLIVAINIGAACLGATTKSSLIGKCKMWILGVTIIFGIISIFSKGLLEHIKSNSLIEFINYFIDNEQIILLALVFTTIGAEIMVFIDYSIRIIKELIQKKQKIRYNFKSKKDLKYVLFDTDYFLNHKDDSLSKHFLKN